jgi:alpha/beta superfamily hydrolase
MQEEKIITIENKGLKIEGLVNNLDTKKAVIVTHPHPLYGGNMYNNVVESVVRAYGVRDYSTLRFNFRGVGRSQGRYDEGEGEQEDVYAGMEYLLKHSNTSIDLAGYSFGAWVNARGIERFHGISRMLMISPPVDATDHSFLRYNAKIKLVIAGSDDDIGPPQMIEKMMARWNPEAELKIIQGADHFYQGKSREIETIIGDFLLRNG